MTIYLCGCKFHGYNGVHDTKEDAYVCALVNLSCRDDGKPVEEIGLLLHPEIAAAVTAKDAIKL